MRTYVVVFLCAAFAIADERFVKKWRCIDDCAAQICGKTTCSTCTSMAMDPTRNEGLKKIINTKMDNGSYQRPEGICYNWSSERKCQSNNDCLEHEFCLESYKRVADGRIDWTSEKKICAAASPEKDTPQVQVHDKIASKDTNTDQKRLPLSRSSTSPHGRHPCSSDCSKFICGDKKCESCTAYTFPLQGNSNTPASTLYYDRPTGTCYNPASQSSHCEKDSDCEIWQMCMYRYARVGEKVNWESEKSFCVDSADRKDYIGADDIDSPLGKLLKNEDKNHILHREGIGIEGRYNIHKDTAAKEDNENTDNHSFETSKKFNTRQSEYDEV